MGARHLSPLLITSLLLFFLPKTALAHLLPLTPKQQVALVEAYNLDREYNLDGYLPAIVMAESSLCVNLHNPKVDREAWGCGQLHERTAYLASGRHWSLHSLHTNNLLNLELSAMVLRGCFQKWGMGTFRGISCYNAGISGRIVYRYVRRVRNYRIQLLQSLQMLLFPLTLPTQRRY